MTKVDLITYQKFVEQLTSNTSKELPTFMDRLDELDENGHRNTGPKINVPLLLTSAIGMAAESGEFCELPKKIFFQGKELNEDAVFHMKRELGDIIFYWMDACTALNLDPNDVIFENVSKLESRYPGGKFDVSMSENRKPGDL
jgi:NTP pyrophosphatase (non-canonical NTP hydrolase)